MFPVFVASQACLHPIPSQQQSNIKLPFSLSHLSLFSSLPQGLALRSSYCSLLTPHLLCSKWSLSSFGLFLLSNFTHPSLFTSSCGQRKLQCPFASVFSTPPTTLLSIPSLFSYLQPASSFAITGKAKPALPVFQWMWLGSIFIEAWIVLHRVSFTDLGCVSQ